MSSRFDDLTIADGPFAPTMDSLRSFECPEWFRDAKLAFWSHWGPQSVPMFGDWYARHLYVEGHPQYNHHWRVYGHPSKTGWKDIIPLWKAENFDPEGLMRLFVDAGSKYFVAQAMHHDNFDNFDSAHNRWNSVNMGPKRDICRLWESAALAHNLPFAMTEHLGASFHWWGNNKHADKTGPYAGVPYDGNDPANRDLYYDNAGLTLENGWLTDNEAFHRHWFARMKDVIDKFQPDLIYSDSHLPFGEIGMRIVAHLYNTSIAKHGFNRAVYTQKDTNPDIYRIGVLDIERGQREDVSPDPWQTDTSVGDWFYNVKDVYKNAKQVLESLVDIVSKNGNLVLNIPQKPDGTLDDQCTYLLTQMASWMKAGQGEGIFGTRPWEKAGEGAAKFAQKSRFDETPVEWSSADFRFTQKAGTVYAYQMLPADDNTGVIRSLAQGRAKRVASVRSLAGEKAEFVQTAAGLNFKLPTPPTASGPVGIAVDFE